jgi:hypothetical protein
MKISKFRKFGKFWWERTTDGKGLSLLIYRLLYAPGKATAWKGHQHEKVMLAMWSAACLDGCVGDILALEICGASNASKTPFYQVLRLPALYCPSYSQKTTEKGRENTPERTHICSLSTYFPCADFNEWWLERCLKDRRIVCRWVVQSAINSESMTARLVTRQTLELAFLAVLLHYDQDVPARPG